jgi:molybdopterin-synthase adenylyltransferase
MLKFFLPELEALHSAANERDVETCAIGLVCPAGSIGDGHHFIVRELHEVPVEAYLRRTPTSAVLAPSYCMELANRARAQGMGVLMAHTHPGNAPLEGFSTVDDEGEHLLSEYFKRRVANATHFAAVVTKNKVFCRVLGNTTAVPAAAIAQKLLLPTTTTSGSLEHYDRQIRAFGIEGQQMLRSTKVAIVGLGGTGSVVAQQLAHLGVSHFVLVDPDTVEESNLNRLVGASLADVGSNKVAMAKRQIMVIQPQARCIEVVGDIVDEDIASHLLEVDFIFACTDSMASRAVMNQLAYQYLIPCIDVGVAVGVINQEVQYITGRTQMLSPGLPCLVCTELLDAEQVRRELLSDEQRKRDPYIVGASVPQPAVISLNSTMSSVAVTMFLAAATGIPSNARMVIYDAIRGTLRPNALEPRAHCIVCSYDGALGRGATWTLPTRRAQPNA